MEFLKIIEKGNKKMTDHNVVDVVTFSFFLFLNLMLINHLYSKKLTQGW